MTRNWLSGAELQADLNTQDGQDNYLMVGLVTAATGANLRPGDHEVLSFTVPPMVGGPLTVDNVEVSDMVVSVNLYGQIHEQTRKLPPGTKISGVTID